MTTNVTAITKYCSLRGFIPNNTKQTIDGFTIYPNDYFCPSCPPTSFFSALKRAVTENTHAIHHVTGSWGTPWDRFKGKVRTRFNLGMKHLLGPKITEKIKAVKKFLREKRAV